MHEESIRWPDGNIMALSVVVNVEEGSEMTVARGDRGMEPVDELGIHIRSPIRNYGNESNYLYGIKAGAPRIVRLLKAYDIMASWTVAALSLENYPEIAAAIAELGHEPVSHGWRWVHQFKMNEEQERAYIRKAVESLTRTTGQRPQGWLSRYLLTENTRRLLIEEGFLYHMDDYGDDEPRWDAVNGKPIVILPYQVDNNDMKMWAQPSVTPDQWLKYACDNLDWALAEGEHEVNMMSIGLHLRIIGRPGRIWALDRFLAYAAERARQPQGVWIATREQIARHFAQQVPWAG